MSTNPPDPPLIELHSNEGRDTSPMHMISADRLEYYRSLDRLVHRPCDPCSRNKR